MDDLTLTRYRAGGFLSTTNDLATIGKAILNHTLIPQSQTNRWLKPSSFLESFSQGVGRPWEIWRRKLHGQSIDLYTKTGDCKFDSEIFIMAIS